MKIYENIDLYIKEKGLPYMVGGLLSEYVDFWNILPNSIKYKFFYWYDESYVRSGFNKIDYLFESFWRLSNISVVTRKDETKIIFEFLVNTDTFFYMPIHMLPDIEAHKMTFNELAKNLKFKGDRPIISIKTKDIIVMTRNNIALSKSLIIYGEDDIPNVLEDLNIYLDGMSDILKNNSVSLAKRL